MMSGTVDNGIYPYVPKPVTHATPTHSLRASHVSSVLSAPIKAAEGHHEYYGRGTGLPLIQYKCRYCVAIGTVATTYIKSHIFSCQLSHFISQQ